VDLLRADGESTADIIHSASHYAQESIGMRPRNLGPLFFGASGSVGPQNEEAAAFRDLNRRAAIILRGKNSLQ
jgi:hypothetical protein